ncbi:MAG: hypothetical protein ACRDJV_07065 [Actinomycetota bacterium]
MFGAPSGAAMAGFQSTVVALVVFAIGYLIVNAVLGKRPLDPVVRAGLVLPALLGASLVLMLVHIVSGGRLFAHPGVVRAITGLGTAALVFLTFARGRRFRDAFPAGPALALLGVVLVALFMWGRIVFEVLPAGKGDTALHMGWASSLLNGERLPYNALTGEIPNYYPWLFHSLIAWLSALTPGGRPFHTLGPLQLLQVASAVTSLFALGNVLWRKWAAGLSTALLGALTGGFGFLAESPRLVYKVRGGGSEVATAFGDLLARRSHNLSFHNLAPIYPREVSYALLPALLLLLVLSLRTGRRFYLIAAGVVLGIIGLIGGEAFIAGSAVAAAFVAVAGRLGRIRAALNVGVPAAILYGLWFGPLILNFRKYGGFFDLSAAPVELTPLQVLGGWGIVTPFAVLGAGLLAARLRSDDGARVVLLSLVAIGGVLLVSLAAGSGVGGGFETLGRPHRYWPMFFQAVAICGGFGLVWALQGMARFHRVAAIALIVAVSAAALASPWIGSRQVKKELLAKSLSSNPALMAALRGDMSSWPAALSPAPGQRCTIAVPRPLTVISYAYSGYRHVWYVWSRAHRNSARVRWRDIYLHIPTDSERRFANEVLTSAQGATGRYYRKIIERYGVDRVIVPEAALNSPALDGYKIEEASSGNEAYGVVHTGDCSDT